MAANNCCQRVVTKAILETLVLRFVCVLAEVTIMTVMLRLENYYEIIFD